MKIALITDGIYPYILGGMQKHSFCLAKYLALAGVAVDVYHPVPKSIPNYLENFGAQVLENLDIIEVESPIPKKFPGHYLYERYQYSKNVAAILKNISEVDFIYGQGFSLWYLLKHKSELNITCPVGINFHGYEMFQKIPDFRTGLKLQILKRPVVSNIYLSDYVFSLGGKITKIITELGIPRERIIELPNGIDSSWLQQNPSKYKEKKNVRKFLFIGRFERRKGIHEIYSACEKISKDPEWEFHFIGPIPPEYQKSRVNFIYHGLVTEPKKLQTVIDGCDYLVCPSYGEGMPTVILEAMSRGLAVIATDVGAVSLLVSAENGFLIDELSIENLSKALEAAIRIDEMKLTQMKKVSLKKVEENFLWDKVAAQTVQKLSNL